jgi:hypothetical protein
MHNFNPLEGGGPEALVCPKQCGIAAFPQPQVAASKQVIIKFCSKLKTHLLKIQLRAFQHNSTSPAQKQSAERAAGAEMINTGLWSKPAQHSTWPAGFMENELQ